VLYAKQATGPQTQLTVMVLVGLKIVGSIENHRVFRTEAGFASYCI
jgi:hypothetical protein